MVHSRALRNINLDAGNKAMNSHSEAKTVKPINISSWATEKNQSAAHRTTGRKKNLSSVQKDFYEKRG